MGFSLCLVFCCCKSCSFPVSVDGGGHYLLLASSQRVVGSTFGWSFFWLVIFGTSRILGSLANRCYTFGFFFWVACYSLCNLVYDVHSGSLFPIVSLLLCTCIYRTGWFPSLVHFDL